jgi:hypothetical protein
VDLGDVLAWCGSDDTAGALDEQAVVGDRPGEEEGIEGWGVDYLGLADVCAGERNEWWSGT